MDFGKLFYLFGMLGMVWLIYRVIRKQPDAFSSKNLQKSFYTLGLLALGLIVFIGLLVMLLRSS